MKLGYDLDLEYSNIKTEIPLRPFSASPGNKVDEGIEGGREGT